MRSLIAFVMLLCCTSVAGAQSTFVGASLLGEIARFDSVESTTGTPFEPFDLSYDGETLGFAVSVERALGERWGVALEFARPGTMSREETRELPISIAIFPPLPPVEIERRFESQRLSWNTTAWFAQPIGDRVELSFAGGVSFTRTKLEETFDVIVPALALIRPEVFGGIRPSRNLTEFRVDPIVGLDARLRLSDHLSVVPGVRLQSGEVGGRAGWLFRPSVGVRWGF